MSKESKATVEKKWREAINTAYNMRSEANAAAEKAFHEAATAAYKAWREAMNKKKKND